jgi:CO/xanthine dehydrogenase Mo-binding subunit
MQRREFLMTGGALVVSFALRPAAAASWPTSPDAKALDSWIRVGADGSVTASVGKIDAGMGISTSFTQIVAEELDVPLDRVTLVMGDTATTVDQRGTGGSNGIQDGGAALREAGAEARAALLSLGAERLGVPAEALRAKEGVVFVAAEPSRRVPYGELVGGRRFELPVSGKVKPKDPHDYTVAGTAVPRLDIPAKVSARYRYITDFSVPGMLHARVIRPPEAGAKVMEVVSRPGVAGLAQVVRRGDLVAVVCEREEQAIDAARALEVRWSAPAPMFWPSYDALYDHLRREKPKATHSQPAKGDVDAAIALAAHAVEARYEYPFQSHASMAPGCAVADVRGGRAQVWSGGQKPYPLRHALAELLGLPVEEIRVTWIAGPGSYGMNDADDAAADAALLSKLVGRPVRLQYMRAEGTGWDPKGPPVAFRMRGGLDGAGKVSTWDYEARGFSGRVRNNGTERAGDTLAGQLSGPLAGKHTDWPQFPAESYAFDNVRKVSHTIDWDRSMPTGLRTAHLRDPDGMATCFASESFMDEMAFAAGADPVEFRLRHLSNAREAAVVKAAAEKAGWERRAGPRAHGGARLVTGRGIAYAPRGGTVVAIVADVEADRETGAWRARRFTCAHDCGFVVNPLTLRGTIEANLIQAMSRTRHEAVRFDERRVLSVDWITYPIVDMTEVPDAIDIVVVGNAPGAKASGAGEPSSRPVAAALANALFDATGVRLRRVPLTQESLLAGLRATRA